MDGGYRIFWGETHHNSYQSPLQDPPLQELLGFVSTYLDFYAAAYYTPQFTSIPPKQAQAMGAARKSLGGHPAEELDAPAQAWRGVRTEDWKEPELLAREWAEVQAATAGWNRAGTFVTFPGYEWQGNGCCGDHNVVYRAEGPQICRAHTVEGLYAYLQELDAIAIPHHTAYRVGHRAPDWSACNEHISPFTELFSVHGCSETDEEWVGLRHNAHMGPGIAGGTYQEALDSGLHLGAICSTDSWTNMPGYWGQGLMACMAAELTRESLWDAFRQRRVYGVTGDRVELEFTCNYADMGRIIDHAPARELRVAVRGSDAIDRIELLRNGRVIATHCHQGSWNQPEPGQRARWKLRVEAGWGSRPDELPFGEKRWHGRLGISAGRIIGWEPCWISSGQSVPVLSRDCAAFAMTSRQEYVSRPFQGGNVFEFEADPEAVLTLGMNGLTERGRIYEFAAGSRLMYFRDESVDFVHRSTGIRAEDTARDDVFYHHALKVKLHRAVPEAAYTAALEYTDTDVLDAETHYRVRVEQRNGQRAWSSPVWVRPQRA